jgi:galactokinase
MDTGAPRSLAASAYNERSRSCRLAVDAIRTLDPEVRALRDVDEPLLERARGRMSEVEHRRARHVVAENRRPPAMADALARSDLAAAGRLMNESHASLRELYEVSSDELDLFCELARRHPACFGARLTGAGFGGCAIALVAAGAAEEFMAEVHAGYRARVDLESAVFACRPAPGARLLEG